MKCKFESGLMPFLKSRIQDISLVISGKEFKKAVSSENKMKELKSAIQAYALLNNYSGKIDDGQLLCIAEWCSSKNEVVFNTETTKDYPFKPCLYIYIMEDGCQFKIRYRERWDDKEALFFTEKGEVIGFPDKE